MAVFSASGANVLTSDVAIDALVDCLSAISDDILWLKNCIGSRSTFHM